MITIDGARGEGGGQVLRTALALSLVTGTAFTLLNARAARPNPGLRPQHLAALLAAATVGSADVEGADLGSRRVVFQPRGVRAGEYRFDVGTAGSATLVAQTVLPPLLLASVGSALTFEGGTHNPMAPPFDFLARAFFPMIERMGPRLDAALDRYGFYPAGAGRFTVRITPVSRLVPLDVGERGDVVRRHARAIVARLPSRIAERELAVVQRILGWPADELETVVVERSASPGNAVTLDVTSARITEVFSAIGARGVPAEIVAERAAVDARDYLATGVPVGRHLADQFLVPLALAGGGGFVTFPLTLHATTNADVIRAFLDIEFRTATPRAGVVRVDVAPRG
ncbi:MAG: RNA 3'-terminal phosphate cyclase [Candidatus Rokubacteria bacterium]|nr:RNA 3'-terminal phosphate cyclase [Candidatus Rokubacteria bacterium]